MTAFLIGTAEAAALEAGWPGVVATPNMAGLASLPLMVLQPNQGVLRAPGGEHEENPAVPLPTNPNLLAILAPDPDSASRLAAGLPAGLPHLSGTNPLPALLGLLLELLTTSGSFGPTLQVPAPFIKPAKPALPPPQPDLAAEMAPTGADFLDLRLHQYTINTDGSYRHIDLELLGLAAAAGIWRQARFKLFDRRGTIGLEVRNAKGWPAMFEIWPKGSSDRFGPFWRLETSGLMEAVAGLASPQDRALVAALVEVLPEAAHRIAGMAGLEEGEQAQWSERGRALAAALSEGSA